MGKKTQTTLVSIKRIPCEEAVYNKELAKYLAAVKKAEEYKQKAYYKFREAISNDLGAPNNI